jgi:hypothetical protein
MTETTELRPPALSWANRQPLRMGFEILVLAERTVAIVAPIPKPHSPSSQHLDSFPEDESP